MKKQDFNKLKKEFWFEHEVIFNFVVNNDEKTFIRVINKTNRAFIKQKVEGVSFYNFVVIPILIDTERYEWIKHVEGCIDILNELRAIKKGKKKGKKEINCVIKN